MRSLADAISIMPVAEHSIEREVLGPLEVLALQVARPTAAARAASRASTTVCTNTREAVDRDHAARCAWSSGAVGRARTLHCTPMNTAGGDDAGDRDDQRQPRATRGSWRTSERSEHDQRARRANSAISGAIANQSIGGVAMSAARRRSPISSGARSAGPRRTRCRRSAGCSAVGVDDALRLAGSRLWSLDVVRSSALDRRLDAVEHRLRVEAEEQRQPEQRHDRARARGRRCRASPRSRSSGSPVNTRWYGPQQVDRGEDHAGRRRRPRTSGSVRNVPSSDEELADEAREAGQADRREHRDDEQAAEDRRRLPEPAEARRSRRCGGGRRACRRGGTARRW